MMIVSKSALSSVRVMWQSKEYTLRFKVLETSEERSMRLMLTAIQTILTTKGAEECKKCKVNEPAQEVVSENGKTLAKVVRKSHRSLHIITDREMWGDDTLSFGNLVDEEYELHAKTRSDMIRGVPLGNPCRLDAG